MSAESQDLNQSPSPPPASAPSPPPPPPAPEDDAALFWISLGSALVGALLLVMALIIFFVVSYSEPGATFPSFFEKRQWILAVGTGLFVLGVGLQANNIWDLLYRRRSLFALNVILMSLLAIALTVLVDYVTSRHFHEFDWTRQGVFTISDESIETAKHLDRDIRIWVVFREGGDAELVRKLVDHYRAVNARIEVLVVDPILDREKLFDAIRELGLEPQKIEDVEGVVVQSGYWEPTPEGGKHWHSEKSKRLTRTDFFESNFDPMTHQQGQKKFRGEQALTNALMEVTEDKKPKLYFTQGHGELDMEGRNPGDYGQVGTLVHELRGKNYEVAALNILERAQKDVPDDASAVVIAGPTRAFDAQEVAALDKYLKSGGKLLGFIGATIKQTAADAAEWRSTGLEALLKKYGIDAADEMVIGIRRKVYQDGSYEDEPAPGGFMTQFDASSKITQRLAGTRVRFVQPRVVRLASDPTAPKGTEILKTSPNYFALADLNKHADEVAKSEKKSLPVMVAVEQKQETKPGEKEKVARLVVAGDAIFATNYTLEAGSNESLILNSLSWLLGQERFTREPVKEGDYHLDMTTELWLLFGLLGCPGVPFIAILLGITVWIVRRR